MEHKSRKMFAAIAVIMLCAVAIIGVGYAYTASTTNDRNNVDTEYVTLYQANGEAASGIEGAYQFADDITVNWNSADGHDATLETPGPATVYTLLESEREEIDVDTGTFGTDTYTLKKVGQSFYIKAKQIGTLANHFSCAVTTTDITAETNVALILKIVNNGDTTYMKLTANGFKAYENKATSEGPAGGFTGGNTFDIDVVSTEYTDTTVTVYYGYAGTTGVKVPHAPGVAPAANLAPSANPVNEGSLVFTATPVTA